MEHLEFKGTKGPWKYISAVVDGFYIETEDEDRFDSFVGDVGGGLQLKNEIESNAKLIAAAPELLEACQEALRMYEAVQPAGGWQMVHDMLKDSIKKSLK